ncbi:Peroxidase 5-like protein [Drosera capensis]
MKNPTVYYIGFLIAMLMAGASTGQLEYGFYKTICPGAEAIVRNVVLRAISLDVGLGAGLIRLLFHDCFVRGCDGSVLIASTASNPSEQVSPINLSLRGFQVIDLAKTQLEAACPGVVSCADIVAFAARDSALWLGGIGYPVAAGRRDGLVSSSADPLQNLPQFNFTLAQLEYTFAAKGLSVQDMVVLSGAHSIGRAHCSSFINRLYPTVDPALDPLFASSLLRICPTPDNITATNNPVTVQDYQTPRILDNRYYQDILQGRVLFTSDEDLVTSTPTLGQVRTYAALGGLWANQFAQAMQKMGQIGALTGTQGEIRNVCSAFN